MSSNSYNIKGLNLGSSPKKPAFLCQSNFKFNSAKRERERSSRAKYRLRQRCLQIFFILFCSVLSNNLKAQIGNSCSNPHVINLVNGLSDENFNITNLDSIVYIKISNVLDKVNLTINMDTSYNDFGVCNIDVLESNCNNGIIANDYFTNYREEIDYTFFSSNIDTVLLKIKFCDFSIYSSNTIINFNLKIKTNQLNSMGGGCIPEYCDNLVLNASLEEFVLPTGPQNNGQSYSDHLCGWENISAQSYYQNPWYDDNSCSPLLGQAICNSAGLTNSYSFSCGYPPQQNNYYFNQNTAYGGLAFGDNITYTLPIGGGVWQPQGILRVELNPSLVNNTTYYVEANIAKKYSTYYGYRLDFDITANPNYISTQYPINTNTSLHSAGIDFDPNLEWTKINTIYTTPATGAEQFMFIGNLTKAPLNPMQTQFTNSLGCSSSNQASTYFFDNLVVKKFYADAGIENVTLCEGEGYQVQPTTCPFQGAVYNWQPAIYFDNNALPNPTITIPNASGLTNLTCSLTVTIQMADGTFATTNPSFVNITIIQGNSITLFGTTTVLTNGYAPLSASGGTNYIWTGSDGTSFTGASINVGPLTQDVTYTVNALSNSGCSVTENITVTVSNIPQACQNVLSIPNTISIPDGYTSTDLKNFMFTNYPTYITMASNNGNGCYSYNISSPANLPLTFLLEGTFTIDNTTGLNFSFANNFIGTPPPPNYSNFYCVDGSNIINNSYLTMNGCSLVACNNMWKGITNNKNLYLNGCYFADAENAVHLANGSNYKISTNVFDNNLYGILMGGIGGGQITGVDYSNIFRSTSQLKPAHANMFFHPAWSEAGIKVFNVNYVQIGAVPAALANFGAATISNRFENINCGINIFNSNVKVVNSWFKDLTHLNPSPAGTLIGLQPEGSGIYARSIGTPKTLSVEPISGYSGNEFEKCKYGIKTFRNSIVANNIRMNNVANGITAQNTIMCSYNLQSNRINAWLNGIDINNAEFANNIVVAYNQINMNFLMGYFGINVTAATSGNFGNTRISNNIVTIANSYNAGIQTSSLKGSLVNCNTVRRTITNPFMTWYSLNGISSLACEKNTLSQNTVNWAPGFNGSPNLGIDILLEVSDEAMVNCNTTGVSKRGLQVAGVNNNATIRANNFGSNDIALYYDNSGVTGPQPANYITDDTEGNRWLGTNTFKAYNAASTPDVQTSIYYVNANQPAINYPDPQLIFPLSWFDGSGLLTYQVPCLIQNCAGRMASNIGNKDFYRSIANRSLTTNGYPAQTLWMAQNTLVKMLTNDSILLNEDDSLQYFYYSPDAQVLRDIDEIGRNNVAFEAQRNLFSHAITANDSLLSILETNYSALNSELTDSVANDSLLLMQKITVLAQYESLKQANEDLSSSLNAYHKANLSISNDLNSELEPRNANEQILKTVNKIYFALRDNDYEYISYEDSAMIAYIAHLCPLAAGPAVFQARDMYALLVDSVLYQDSAICSNEGYARESLTPFVPKLNNKVTEANYFKAFPVPAQNSINLSFNELKSAVIVYIYDMEGRLMLSKNINSNNRNAQLELSQIPAGIYHVLLMNNERAERTKITVIK